MTDPAAPIIVLIVDDEDAVRDALHRYLARSGYQALEAGVPMIALWNQLEQKLTGEMLARHGMGLCSQARRTSPAWLVNALNEVMTDPKYREASRRYSSVVAAATGAAAAAKILEDVARRGEPAGADLS